MEGFYLQDYCSFLRFQLSLRCKVYETAKWRHLLLLFDNRSCLKLEEGQCVRFLEFLLIVFQFFRFSLSRIFAGNIHFYYEGFSSYRKPYKEYVDVCETNFSSSSACLSYGKGLILAGSYLMCCFMLRFLYLRLSGLLLIPIIGVILFLIKVFLQNYIVYV